MNRARDPFSFADPTKQSVVGSDKELAGAFDDDSSARGSHAGIDNADMNSTGRKVLICGQQIEGGRPDILRRNFVGDINDAGVGIDGEYRPLHRAHEIILRAKISQESDQGWFQVSGFNFRCLGRHAVGSVRFRNSVAKEELVTEPRAVATGCENSTVHHSSVLLWFRVFPARTKPAPLRDFVDRFTLRAVTFKNTTPLRATDLM